MIAKCVECEKEYELKFGDKPKDFECVCGGNLRILTFKELHQKNKEKFQIESNTTETKLETIPNGEKSKSHKSFKDLYVETERKEQKFYDKHKKGIKFSLKIIIIIFIAIGSFFWLFLFFPIGIFGFVVLFGIFYGDRRKNLISCPDCGRKVSNKAETCPKCGHPFN